MGRGVTGNPKDGFLREPKPTKKYWENHRDPLDTGPLRSPQISHYAWALPGGSSQLVKWLATPINKPLRPFGRGTTLLRGLIKHGY